MRPEKFLQSSDEGKFSACSRIVLGEVSAE